MQFAVGGPCASYEGSIHRWHTACEPSQVAMADWGARLWRCPGCSEQLQRLGCSGVSQHWPDHKLLTSPCQPAQACALIDQGSAVVPPRLALLVYPDLLYPDLLHNLQVLKPDVQATQPRPAIVEATQSADHSLTPIPHSAVLLTCTPGLAGHLAPLGMSPCWEPSGSWWC